MISVDDIRSIIGRQVVDPDGNKIGTAEQVFQDDQTNRPEWITVKTGLFGTRETFVPVSDADLRGDEICVPYTKDKVKDAPNVDVDEGHLSAEEEQRLFRHYGRDYGSGYTDTDRDRYTDTDVAAGRSTETVDRDRDTSRVRSDDDAMTRSEEQLRVGTEKVQTGRVRLRKWVETEQVDVPVTVSKEKARLVSEPITDANRGDALSGPDITEDEHEVVLTEERPLVEKETVPVERVRLETEKVQQQEVVSDEVRKERIDTDGAVDESIGRNRA